jgi:hypothetical protein
MTVQVVRETLARLEQRWPRGLTVCQPYAHLIACGQKPIENRTWSTPYRGPLLVHAGLSRAWLDPGETARYPDLAFGAVVAIAELVDCRPVSQLPPALRDHEHANGPLCWVLERVVPLARPVPATGARGLWYASDALVVAVRTQLRGLAA